MGKRGTKHRFMTGGAVDPSQHIGREELIGQCFEDIRKCSSVFLRGGPKTGKSSLLKKLRDPATRKLELEEDGEYIVPVYISGQMFSEPPAPKDFWREVITKLHMELPGEKPKLPEVYSDKEVRTFLTLLKKSPHEITPVLLLDEADVWVGLPSLDGPFFSHLRTLQEDKLICIVAASQQQSTWNQAQLNDKGQKGSGFFNVFHNRPLKVLSDEESRDVLRQGRMDEDAELELILKLASGHPFCLQALGKSRLECTSETWCPDSEQFTQTVTALWECSTDEEQVKLLRWSAGTTDAANSGEAPRLFPPILRLAFRVCRPWFSPIESSRGDQKTLAQYILQAANGPESVHTMRRWACDVGLKEEEINWNKSAKAVAGLLAEKALHTGKPQALVDRIKEDYPALTWMPSQDTLPPALQRLVDQRILEEREARSLYDALKAPEDWKKGFDALRNELLKPGGDP